MSLKGHDDIVTFGERKSSNPQQLYRHITCKQKLNITAIPSRPKRRIISLFHPPPLRMLYFIFHNLLQAMVRSRGLFLPIKGEII